MSVIKRIALASSSKEIILTPEETAEFVAGLSDFDQQCFSGVTQLRGVRYSDGKPDANADGWAMGRDWYFHS